ncbi:MAG: LacI family DNA-binding transcriptional regulator [Verrucomicrobia bacterium]|nr:LacI family DNA-binding transcriptional regulator [Verrucomicrobiota bacterium]
MRTRKQTSRTAPRDATIVDVALHANVSLATVSRVINRNPKVAPAMGEKVLVACRELGFAPKVQRHAIGVVVDFNPAMLFGASAALVAMMMKELAKRDYTMELIELEDLQLAFVAHVEGVIGIIFDERFAVLTKIPKLPLLTINQPMLDQGIHSVVSDHYQQGALATEHLLARGHLRIAFLENGPTNWGSRQRLAGYRASLAKAGVAFDPQFVCYAQGDTLYAPLNRVVKQGVTAIVNFSEDYGFEAIHILTHILKLSIPDDISVVTMENLPVFKYLTPPQTVVRQPFDQLVRTAVEQMLKLCSERAKLGVGNKLVNIKLPCELIERESVAPVSAPAKVPATSASVLRRER